MTGIRRWATLSFRLHRWEVLASAAGVALLAAAMLWFAWQLRFVAAGDPGCPDPAAYVPGCEQLAQRFGELSEWGSQLLYLSWGAPFGMGLLLGVPLVAREVESGTAGMAWTLSRSRTRWLAARLAFLALVLLALLAVVVLVSRALAAALLPQFDLERDFTWYGRRDWLIVARGLAALGIGVLVGAAVGRLLPGLLEAAFASVLVFAGVSQGMDRWNETEADAGAHGLAQQGALVLGQRIELPSGELVDWGHVAALGDTQMIDAGGAIYTAWDDMTGQPDPESLVGWDRQLAIPGERYPQILVRESGVVAGVAVLATLAALSVIRRRRPA